ncbi:Os05g0388466 [Oryza sativa Japonica Group]|uniref:Os05g0388466 protein n=1 Tax=Oryza sativa subsp. japonica TaxID=39947 RepID=A0A0N7KKP9_ORYSJ|nr:Os05g0388466 [Oryza sativa Japonica Group]
MDTRSSNEESREKGELSCCGGRSLTRVASRSVDSERIVATATGREREEGAIDEEAATATVSNDEDGSSPSGTVAARAALTAAAAQPQRLGCPGEKRNRVRDWGMKDFG